MIIDNIKKRYEALLPVPEVPGEREWVDRVTNFESFFQNGPLVADSLGRMSERDRERVRRFAPELYDLLVEVFPID